MRRGANSSQVIATVGRSVFEAANQSGVVESWESRDFIVAVSDLPFGEPQRHDKIVEQLNGISVVYDVTSPRGVPLFHYGDAFRQTVRIHTIATEEAATIPSTMRLRYWGAYSGESITNAQIAQLLSSDLGGSRAQSRVITANTEYIYFVLPTSFGSPTFAVSGLTSSAWELTQREIAFSGQAAASYSIFRSAYRITGTVSISVA